MSMLVVSRKDSAALGVVPLRVVLWHTPIRAIWVCFKQIDKTKNPQQWACYRNAIAERYLRVVKRVAKKAHRRIPQELHVDIRDLEQEGTFGLLEAIERYDPNRREAKFSSFAWKHIFGAIEDYLRSIDIAPRRVREWAKWLDRFSERIFQRGKRREFSSTELKAERDLGIVRWQLNRRLSRVELYHQLVSRKRKYAENPSFRDAAQIPRFIQLRLETRLRRGETSSVRGDFVPSRETSPLDTVVARDLVPEILRGHPRDEQLIIVLFYGVGMTMAAVGSVIGIDESRVSQLLTFEIDPRLEERTLRLGGESGVVKRLRSGRR